MIQLVRKTLVVYCLLLGYSGFYSKAAAGVVSDYNKSNNLYRSGKISKAIRNLKATLKRYPKHQASIELLVQIYLQKKRYKSAVRLLLKKKPAYLDGDISFTIGIHYYKKNECRFTQYFLKKVPTEHRNYSDSLIYRSICLMRNQKWSLAYNLLRKAKNPSPSLDASKQELLRVARSAYRSETSGFRSRAISQVTPRAPVLNYRASPTGRNLSEKSAEKKVVRPTIEVKSTPKFQVESLNDQREKHGFSNSNSSKFTYEAGGSFDAVYDFSLSGDRAGKFYSGFELFYETSQSNGETITNEISASDPGQITSSSEPFESDGEISESANIKVAPGVSFPINPYWSLYADFEYQQYFLKSEKSSRQLGVGTSVSIDSVSLSAAYKNKGNYDEKSAVTSSSHVMSAGLSKDWEKFSAELKVLFSLKGEPIDLEVYAGPLSSINLQVVTDYSFDNFSVGLNFGLISLTPNDKLPLDSSEYGATQQVALKGKVSVPLPYNLLVSVNADFENITDYIMAGESTRDKEDGSGPGDIKAQGQKISVTPVVSFKPLDFLTFNLSYALSMYEYVTDVPEDQTTFEQKNNNIERKFTGILTFSKTI